MSGSMKAVNYKAESYYDVWDRKAELKTTGLGIVFIGFIMPVVVMGIAGMVDENFIPRVFLTFFNTTALWLGCRIIVIKMAAWLPWTQYPVRHLLSEFVVIILYTLFVSSITWIVVQQSEFFERNEFLFWREFAISAAISLVISFIHEGVFFYHQWKMHLLRSEALEKENISSQYEVLRAQINPHFLFNSLNTLMSLIEEDKEMAIGYLSKMSGFFRQILSVGGDPFVSLRDEIKLINLYYELQQKRYGAGFVLINRVDTLNLESLIPPLTLQMLVENAIKHNVASTRNPLIVKIETTDNQYLIVENNLQERIDQAPGTGTGLKNILKRYTLAGYPDVIINASSTAFTVALPLIFENKLSNNMQPE